MGWLLAATCATLLAHYALDRLLVLPRLVRIALSLGVFAFLLVGLRRRILYPLMRAFTNDDMALLVERGYPKLQQELISAVQLDADAARGDSPELILATQQRAEDDIGRLDFGQLMRPRRTIRVWSIAAGLSAVFVGCALLAPASFGVWTQRFFGANVRYPRKTFLTLVVPEGQGNFRIVRPEDSSTDDRSSPILVDLARGADLPINVDVEGTVPATVDLEITTLSEGASTRSQPMARRGASHFRWVLRRILSPVRLQAIGGDDPGTRIVEVRVLNPPAITGLSVAIEPPAYTRRPRSTQDGGLVEALPGSQIDVRFSATEPLRSATLQFQESGLELQAVVAESGLDGGAPGGQWIAHFAMPDKPDRYRIHAIARNGLKENSPGLHSVVPTPDRKPSVRLFTPGPSLEALTPGAAFPLRFTVTDDYGLTRIELGARVGTQGEENRRVLFTALTKGKGLTEGKGPTKRRRFLELVAPKALVSSEGQRPPREGDRLAVRILATDNRLPKAQTGNAQGFRIDLLDVEELRRRLQAQLRTTRRTVERAMKVQIEQQTRVETFLAEVSEGSGTESRRKLGLTAAEAGQQRVRGFLLQIRGDLASVLDSHIFNGLDPSPALPDVVATYLSYYRKHADAAASDPGFYVELAKARADGRIGKLDLIGRLSTMFMIAHGTLEEALAGTLRSLAEASTAESDQAFQAAIISVGKRQEAVVSNLNTLLRLLEDWNDYQDVVRMARRILGAERDLIERIRQQR